MMVDEMRLGDCIEVTDRNDQVACTISPTLTQTGRKGFLVRLGQGFYFQDNAGTWQEIRLGEKLKVASLTHGFAAFIEPKYKRGKQVFRIAIDAPRDYIFKKIKHQNAAKYPNNQNKHLARAG